MCPRHMRKYRHNQLDFVSVVDSVSSWRPYLNGHVCMHDKLIRIPKILYALTSFLRMTWKRREEKFLCQQNEKSGGMWRGWLDWRHRWFKRFQMRLNFVLLVGFKGKQKSLLLMKCLCKYFSLGFELKIKLKFYWKRETIYFWISFRFLKDEQG